MKSYPSIPDDYASYFGRRCLAFYKYDGSNMRFLWTKKQGWCRFGTRNQLIDKNTLLYGQAIEVFEKKYKDRLTWVIRNDPLFKGVNEVMAFAEFYGASSFAGQHKLNEPKELVLFDINVGTKGFMDPVTFYSKFKHIGVAEPVYDGILTQEFSNEIRQKGLPTIPNTPKAFEGVICKGGEKHKLWMVKIKSRAYIDQLKAREAEINNWSIA